MAQDSKSQDTHDKARDLAEKAIDTALDGDTSKGRELAEKARRLDPQATEEVAREVEKDRAAADKFKE